MGWVERITRWQRLINYYQGLTNKEIGVRLMISESTVKKHLHHIF
ncbi:MAG: helix-turn-helix transcriptional regulator [Bacillota bacterium]